MDEAMNSSSCSQTPKKAGEDHLVVIHLFECSTHASQYAITDEGHLLLSDKLLGMIE